MAIWTLRTDGYDVSVNFIDAEDNATTKPVFLPCQDRIENYSNSECEGQRSVTLERGFVTSISEIYKRYQQGVTSKNDIQIIMDTIAHFGHMSMQLLDFRKSKEFDDVHNLKITRSQQNGTGMTNKLRHHAHEKFIGRGNRKNWLISRHAKAVRATISSKTVVGDRYVAKDCGRKFKRSSNLNQHQRIHVRERQHECRDCGKTFTHGGNLHRHMRIHSDEKLHSCFVCGKRFIEKCNLKTHIEIHTNKKEYID
ncbi:zinc finger protein 571-like [Ptychodera flava]|uniref:zinc finger protein 571-like n=1 Tax=Ptychodera flava TaxID=63121 RepID=UPI003969FB74